ncbi:hypothetical protein GCM10023215_34020 [Pseudonocardia yuanmonensis]|uniref:Uncharacterized protein n=1 Tax=Pseudonocardia yuanmonensis TaxID=1095914 RepID=A0ABP8WQ99_9PSEU
MHTTDIDALQQLPEGQATGLYYDWEDVNFQANFNNCYVTCNITQVNANG